MDMQIEKINLNYSELFT